MATVAFIGAPFCEGQNLEGTDLGPSALREAGLDRGAKKLGWTWEDVGDLDFATHFRKAGMSADSPSHIDKLDLYREWLSSPGLQTNFSEWVSAGRKRKEPERALKERTEHSPLQSIKSAKSDAPQGVVNAEVHRGARTHRPARDEPLRAPLLGRVSRALRRPP